MITKQTIQIFLNCLREISVSVILNFIYEKLHTIKAVTTACSGIGDLST